MDSYSIYWLCLGRMCSGIFFQLSDKIGPKVAWLSCSQRLRTTGIVSCIYRLAQLAKHILRVNICGLSNKEIFLYLMDLYYSILLVSWVPSIGKIFFCLRRTWTYFNDSDIFQQRSHWEKTRRIQDFLFARYSNVISITFKSFLRWIRQSSQCTLNVV